MKSSTFEAKPVVRYNHNANVWVCTWRDPCRTGRYAKHPYWGMGSTMQEAMQKCQKQYNVISLSDEQSDKMIQQAVSDNHDAVMAQSLKRDWKRFWPW